MFAETRIVNPFPIPVWVHRLVPEQAARINETVLQALEQIRAETPAMAPNQQWQTPNDLQDRPDFAPLNELFKEATSGALKQLGVEYGSFTITGCWVNIMPKGSQSHPRHTHPNNYLSGVYYVQVPTGGDSIVFHDPKPQTNVITPRVATPNAYNARQATLPIQEGVMAMFPSWLAHSVPPHQGEKDRISVSFNIMFEQFAEQMSRPKWSFDATAFSESQTGARSA